MLRIAILRDRFVRSKPLLPRRFSVGLAEVAGRRRMYLAANIRPRSSDLLANLANHFRGFQNQIPENK